MISSIRTSRVLSAAAVAALIAVGRTTGAAEVEAATSVSIGVATNDGGQATLSADAIRKAVEAALPALMGAVTTDAGTGGIKVDAVALDAIRQAVQAALPGLVGAGGTNGSDIIRIGGVPLGAGASMLPSPAAQAPSTPRTWLGIAADEVGADLRAQLPLAEGEGVIVRHVEEDSPAAKAGIQANDILTKLDDQILVNGGQLGQLVRMHKDGDTVTLAGLRKGQALTFQATLATHADGGDAGPSVQIIRLGGDGAGLRMELPEELRKLLEAGAGATIFSTNITIRTSTRRKGEKTQP